MSGSNPQISFLGKGWSFPPSFAGQGQDVQVVAEDADIQQSLQILLSTAPGERVMLENFGCDMHGFVFEEITQSLTNSLTNMINNAILIYEPRISLNQVKIDISKDTAGLLLIGIDYTVRSTNSRFNMVYPFYSKEASYLNHGLAA